MKTIRKPLLFLLTAALAATGVSFAFAWQEEKDTYPTSGSSESAQSIGTATTVAKIGSTEYKTIEGAVAAANSSSSAVTINVVPGTNPTILHDITINSNVTFSIPYDSSGNINARGSRKINQFGDGTASDRTTYLKNNVTIAEGVTVTVNGNFNVGAITAHQVQSLNGQVTGDFCEVTLSANSTLKLNGTNYVYGYIKEKGSFDNGSRVLMGSSSVTYVPFCIHDFRGGSATMSIQSFMNPFDIFDFPSIQPRTKYPYGSRLVGMVRLYISGWQEAQAAVLGTSNAEFIMGSSSSYIETHYHPTFEGGIAYTRIDTDTTAFADRQYMDVEINGDGSLGYVSASVLSTMDKQLPLSSRFFIKVKSGTFNVPYAAKFLTGSCIEVSQSATLNISSTIVIYGDSEFTNNAVKCTTKQYPALIDKVGASFVVKGTCNLTAASSIGGLIRTEGDGAKLSVVTSNLTASAAEEKTKSKVTISKAAQFYSYQSGSSATLQNLSQGKFLGASSSWVTDDSTIGIEYHHLNLPSGNPSISPSTFVKTDVFTVDLANPMEGYYCEGYYTDSSCDASKSLGRFHASSYFTDYAASSMDIYVNWQPIPEGKSWVKVRILTQEGGEVFDSIGLLIDDPSTTQYTITDNDLSTGTQLLLGETEAQLLGFNGWHVVGNDDGNGNPLDADCATGDVIDVRNAASPNIDIYPVFGSTPIAYPTAAVSRTSGSDSLAKGNTNTFAITWTDPASFIGMFESAGGQYSYSWTPTSSTISDTKLGVTINESTYSLKNNYSDSSDNGTGTVSIGCSITLVLGTDEHVITASSFSQTYKKYTSGCVAAGSLVTMADGTTKPIEEVRQGDEIMTFDHETGEPSSNYVAYVYKDSGVEHDAIDLAFSNGESITVLDGHGFFDADTNRYEVITAANASSYIGHSFYSMGLDGEGAWVTLEDAECTRAVMDAFSILSTYDINHVVNGMLAVSDDIEGLFNIFELDENMKVDQMKKQRDIDTYGLCSYEDWADYCTPLEFEVFNCQYLSISVGKGLTTIESLMERMLRFTGKSA